jgi:hypothetical protein
LPAKLGDVGDFLPISAHLEKDGMFDLATQMYHGSQSICHYNEIRKDASAAKEHVSLTSDDFYGAKRFCKWLEVGVERYKVLRPISQYFRAFARAASMPLILARECTVALRAPPHGSLHSHLTRQSWATATESERRPEWKWFKHLKCEHAPGGGSLQCLVRWTVIISNGEEAFALISIAAGETRFESAQGHLSLSTCQASNANVEGTLRQSYRGCWIPLT